MADYIEIREKLQALKMLQEEGLITQQDYDRQKAALLSQLTQSSDPVIPQEEHAQEKDPLQQGSAQEEHSQPEAAGEEVSRKQVAGWIVAIILSASALFFLARMAAYFGTVN